MSKSLLLPRVTLLEKEREKEGKKILKKFFFYDAEFNAIFDNIYDSMFFGIYSDKMFGCAWYILNYQIDDFRSIYLNRLGLLLKYRKQSHGLTLLTESINLLKNVKANIEYISLYCSEEMSTFYEKIGFEEFTLPIDIEDPTGLKNMRLNRNNFNYKK